MSAKLRLVAVALAVFAVAFGVTLLAVPLLNSEGGGSAAPAGATQLRWTVEDARNFTDFPLYWLGESYQGLPLSKIIRYKYGPDPSKTWEFPEDSVTFLYGSCTPSQDSGCAAPVQIIIEPYCMRPPELLAERVRGTPFAIRGATAEQVGNHLRLWTQDVSIAIFAEGLASQTDVAEGISPVAAEPGAASSTLGPPEPSC